MATLDPISGNLGAKKAAHLLKHITFGASQPQIDTFANYNVNQALDALFNDFSFPLAPVKPDGSAWVDSLPLDDEKDFELLQYFKCWWLGLMYNGSNALEKFVFFIHTVIPTKEEIGGSARDIYFQNSLYRLYLINDFSNIKPEFNRYNQLLKKICLDNSMLNFLDGRVNVKGRPNENFARELFELFAMGKGSTIGIGNYTNYTETDIKEAAKVFTGWDKDNTFLTKDAETLLPRGKIKGSLANANSHDNTKKIFTSALASSEFPVPEIIPTTIIPTETTALAEINQLIDMIFAKEEASNYLMRKIYRFFVHYNITEAIENDVIKPLGLIFKSSGFRLRTVLETLFKSEHFYEAASGINDDKMGGMIKSPLDLIFGTLKYFEVTFPTSGTQVFNNKMLKIQNYMSEMGLRLLDPYDVAGYEPYYQAPLFNRSWINTNTLLRRYQFINDLFTFNEDNLTFIDPLIWFNDSKNGVTNAIATAETSINNQKLAKELLEYIASKFLVYYTPISQISEARYNYFAIYHLGGLSFENWVFNWNNRNGTNMMIQEDARARLKNIFNVLMQSPEYQLM